MAIIGDALLSIFSKRTITAPVFLKEYNNDNSQLNDLIELSKKIVSNKKDLIDRDIALLKYGLDGEQNVYYELKNSFVPILCLHDIRLEYNDYVAQFDFIIITNKFILVLETKKLSGDIEINAGGDFIRNFKNSYGKVVRKEGMYSPISQNERHINILREILVKQGLITNYPVKSLVVIANPKTIVNKLKCPKAIQNNVCKYDQIAVFLKKELNDKKNELDVPEKYRYPIAEFLIKNNKPITFDYISKYALADEDFAKIEQPATPRTILKIEEPVVTKAPIENITPISHQSQCETPTYLALKEYRLKTSREEGLKPYMVYNNQEMELLIEKNPKNKEELLQVKGFGEKKVEKYGESILNILSSINKGL